LNINGTPAVITNILLNLVENDQGKGEFAIFGQSFLNGLDHI